MKLAALFLAELLVFLLASINQRATAKYRIAPTLITDGLIAAVNFMLIGWVAEASTHIEQFVFVIGAVTGSYLGMLMTRSWEDSPK